MHILTIIEWLISFHSILFKNDFSELGFGNIFFVVLFICLQAYYYYSVQVRIFLRVLNLLNLVE